MHHDEHPCSHHRPHSLSHGPGGLSIMASRDSTETERKYDTGHTARVPVFADIAGVEPAGEPSETFLEAVYYDTAGLELAARGITLRRRTGGTDQGWHLKLPAGPDSRRELQAPLGQPDHVPAELLDHLAVFTRGQELSPVARLSTRRSTYSLHGSAGEHLADFTDDRVHAVPLHNLGPVTHWREWELELVHGTPELFTSAQPALEAAGAVPSAYAAKVARALGPSWPEARTAGPVAPRKKGPVRDVVTAYVGAQINELLTHDAGVRQGVPDSVHQMRSAARRLRSVLRTYRTLFKKGAVVGLERDLQWLGRILGRPRDAEVMRARILANLHALPEAQASGPALGQIEHELGTAYNTGYQRALATLSSARYYRIVTALEHFRDNPLAKSKASRPARKASARLVNKAARRLDRAHKAARKAAGTAEYDTTLHQVRKDAKRLRHAAESATAINRKRARVLEKTGHRIQSVLGDHQDTVVARELLNRLASAPDMAAGTAAVYKALTEQEAETAAKTETAYRKLRKKTRGRRLQT
ncbi:CYTH and CHAD domain-containing protein [Pseudarthrobacter sp. HLT3-5]|uniref:CYTH and CHAD domain-containing protein n=1 Tax=Pseudarthrobacter cellobiosi TaxID=2953654 RepID=UPI00208F3150|nr:CHAD domain-containing protein [Pseudarthrobacter sp. HLT3-5]MCO4276030.1 CYTH and CHAD domain-containing protein [Pseudarthrobacter sp. HLT3-5]